MSSQGSRDERRLRRESSSEGVMSDGMGGAGGIEGEGDGVGVEEVMLLKCMRRLLVVAT